jgi:hypothetical protein
MAETKTGTLKTLAAGSVFTYGGIRWLVLEQSGAAALSLAVDLLPETMPFDEQDRNDWAVSSLRDYLNGAFIKQLVEAGADAEAFMEMVADLTSDDGLTDYGTDRCKIALISDAQYRRFRKLIPEVDNWWWTITPFSTEKNGYSRLARYVDTSGALLSDNARCGRYGARPLCNLKSSILVSFDPEEVQVEWNNKNEDTEKKQRADALDMMRHIAAAWDVKPEELAGIFKQKENAAPPASEVPERVKRFLVDVLGVPESVAASATLTETEDGVVVELSGEITEQEIKDTDDLRADIQELIAFTQDRFTESNGAGGFNPECFSTLMMAYRSAIEMQSWCEDCEKGGGGNGD